MSVMFKKVLSALSFNTGTVFYKTFLFFLLPIFCFFISTLFTYRYYVQLSEQEAKSNYTNALQTVAGTIDSTIYEIYRSNNLLSLDQDLTDLLFTNKPLLPQDYGKILRCVSLLQRFRTTKDVIDSVFIVDRNNNLVISSDGTMSIKDFFNNYYHYEKYPMNFWMDLSLHTTEYKLLPPSKVSNTAFSQKPKHILPFLQPGVGSLISRNPFVVNINTEGLNKLLLKYRLSPNSVLFLTDTEGTIISCTDLEGKLALGKNSPMLHQIIQNKDTIFIQSINGIKTLTILYKTKILSNDLVYGACIPLEDIYAKSAHIKNLAYGISLVTLLIAVIISFLMARHLYSPVKKLASIMKQKTYGSDQISSARNEYDLIHTGISQIISNSENLSNELTLVLPLAYEQSLLNVLNQNEFSEIDASETISKVNIGFKYTSFAAAVIQFNYKRDYYSNFSQEEQQLIINGIRTIISSLFPPEFQVIQVSVEKFRLCLVINMPDELKLHAVVDCLQELYQLFSNDTNYLQLFIGVGLVHENLGGLRQSYNEALHALSLLSPFSIEKIKLHVPDNIQSSYQFHYEEENKLFNYLMKGSSEEAFQLLEAVIKRALDMNVSESSLKELYLQLYLIGQRVLKNKGILQEDLMGNETIDVTSHYHELNPKAVVDYVSALYKSISSIDGNHTDKIEIQSIKNYIDAHYHEDIYLEHLAGKYHTSAPYLSRTLKNGLGMSFSQYLSKLRITKAKELLINSEKSIGDIAGEVGFNSRYTFLRMFKKLEGISPTEYRDMNDNSSSFAH